MLFYHQKSSRTERLLYIIIISFFHSSLSETFLWHFIYMCFILIELVPVTRLFLGMLSIFSREDKTQRYISGMYFNFYWVLCVLLFDSRFQSQCQHLEPQTGRWPFRMETLQNRYKLHRLPKDHDATYNTPFIHVTNMYAIFWH